MSEWICIKCDTHMSSKCPGQRSEFFGAEANLVRNLLTTQVIPIHPGHTEVFLNMTHYGDEDPIIASVKQLAEWKDKLAPVTCDHIFVLNSETITECVLGHTHYNLKDKEELLTEYTAEPPTFETVRKGYSDAVYALLGRMSADLRGHIRGEENRNFYFQYQDDIQYLKYDVTKKIDKIGKGSTWQSKYRVTFRYRSDIPEIHTDDILQATMIAKTYLRAGTACQVLVRNDDGTSHKYEQLESDTDVRLTCCHCKQPINDGDKLIAAEPFEEDFVGREKQVRPRGNVMHASCQRAIVYDCTEHRTRIRIDLAEHEQVSPMTDETMEKILIDRLPGSRSAHLLKVDSCYPRRTRRKGDWVQVLSSFIVVVIGIGADLKALRGK